MIVNPHPTDDQLRGYGLGKLDDPSHDTVESHLTGCDDCRGRLTGLSADSFVNRMRAAGPTDGTVAQSADAGPPSAPPADDSTVVLTDGGRYADVKPLGQGGMGTVYLARNVRLDRPEVLKVVSRELLDKPGAGDRFVREMQAAARLTHPNIVTAYAAPEFGGLVVFAMEYVPGEDLSRVVKARGPLKVPTACYYAYQVALGLQHAHDKGMVHRDIKPSNLMLLTDGKKRAVKILDFGLAKAKNETAGRPDLTGSGVMLGTPDYMAPEQTVDAAAADIRADIYALGGTLFFLLTGRPPYRAANLLDMLLLHRDAPPPDPQAVRPDLPAELAAVVVRMLAKKPADRFATPAEAAEALKPFFLPGSLAKTGASVELAAIPLPARSEPVELDFSMAAAPAPPSPRRPIPPRRRRPPVLIWAGVLGAAVAAAWLTVALMVKVKTADGTLEVTVDPPDAELLIDGRAVTITWKDGQTAVVSVPPGNHEVEVRKDGFIAHGERVTVEPGAGKRLTARLVPAAPPPMVAPSAPAESAPFDARAFGPGQYKVFTQQLSWKQAKARCEQIGGRLAVVADDAHNRFLTGLMNGAGLAEAWIGATDEAEEGRWVGTDGRPLGYTNWAPTQPNNKGGVEHYALLQVGRGGEYRDNAKWSDQPDVSTQHQPGFVCEWPGTAAAPSAPAAGTPPATPDPLAVPRRAAVRGGRWAVQGDELIQTDSRADNCRMFFGSPKWTEYDFTFTAVKTAGAFGTGGIVSAADERNYLFFDLGGWQNRFYSVERLTDGKFEWGPHRTPGGMRPNRAYRTNLVVRDNSVRWLVDGKQVYEVPNRRPPGGMVGFRTWGAAVRLSDIKVTAPDGSVLWVGPPDV